MENASANEPLPVALDARSNVKSGNTHRRRRRKRATDRAPRLYAHCDRATGILLLALAVFTPWALGGTESWAIWLANLLALATGGLLVVKRVTRQREGFQPTRWGDANRTSVPNPGQAADVHVPLQLFPASPLLRFIAVAQLAGLGLVAAGLLHSVEPTPGASGTHLFPHTIDRATTLRVLFQYIGLVCVFWAARDWMLYRSAREVKAADTATPAVGAKAPVDPFAAVLVPTRLRAFLWVLCINGTLLAVVAFLQRASGSDLLLWFFDPPADTNPDTTFGPWPYRSAAGHYFNLLWPACLGFWLWMQERASRLSTSALARFDGPQVALLPCVAILAAAPTFSGSRLATLVGMGLAVVSGLVLFTVSRREVMQRVRILTFGSLATAMVAMGLLGWGTVRDRFLNPDHLVPTGIAVDNQPFTLLVHLRVPAVPPRIWTPLVVMRGDLQPERVRRSAGLGLTPEGSLVLQFIGETAADTAGKTCAGFVSAYAGKEVDLVLLRDRDVRIFANGKELGTVATRNGDSPGWLAPLESRYLNVVNHAVLEVGLLDAALRAEELPTPPHTGFAKLGERILAARSYRADGSDLTNRLALVDGVTAELRTDTQDAAARWALLRRPTTPGPLGFVRPLPGADPLLRGAVRVTLAAKNTASLPLYLVVNVDGGEFASIEVPPRTEQIVSARCRIPHDGAPSNIGVAVASRDEPNESAIQPAESQILVRDLQLSPASGFVSRPFNPELRAGMFGTPFTGQHEVAQVASRIAADHAPWGCGAGTFALAYRNYVEPGRPFAPFAYDDWLETRATLGWGALAAAAAGFILLFLRSCTGRGIPTISIIIVLLWISLGGCLVASLLDSPFQNFAVVQLFTVFAALVSALGPARVRHR